MKTIETIATVTPDGTLILQLPLNLLPGTHQVVLVINEQVITDARAEARTLGTLKAEPARTASESSETSRAAISSTLVVSDPIWQLGTNPIALGIPDAASKSSRRVDPH